MIEFLAQTPTDMMSGFGGNTDSAETAALGRV
jgi:hypothetical protein